jgi:outer membrane protein assembly factor BamB
MLHRVWLGNRAVIWLCVLLLPPLGLILLWMRRNSRLWTRLLGSLAAITCGILHLFLFWGLKMEMDGGVSRPFFTFRNSARHNAEIEKRRAQERSVDASLLQDPPPAATPATAPDEKAKPAPDAAPAPKPAVTRAYWTEFRGPGRIGIYAETEILADWPSGGLPLLWKRPVGGGYASVVIADSMIFTIEQRRRREVVAAYELDSGREKWIHGWDAEFRETLGGDGPRATPLWHEGRLYALGATGEFRCLDAQSGKRIWSRNILSENGAENLTWGMAASPLIVDEKVIVLPGGSGGKSVAAYNRLTGDPIWKSLDDRQAYVSPQRATLAGRRQILVVSGSRVTGLAVENGALLWEYPWATQNGINIAQPIVTAGNRFFISAGYDHGAALVEISAKGDAYEARTVWQNNRMKNKFGSSVLHEGYIYGLDEAILACIDASTGELKWKGGRYGYGQVLLASGRLIISTESGDVALVKADPEKHQELARFPAIEGKTWNVPAIADGRLIVRNSTEMACFRISK